VHTGWIEEEYQPDPGAADDQEESGEDLSRVRIQIGNRWLTVSLPVLEQTVDGPLGQVREQARERLRDAGPAGNGVISAPMQGTVVRLAVSDGDEVEAGEILVVIEAMKMENPVRATQAGRVEGLALSVGDTVAQGEVLGQVHEEEVS
jgi:acetyl-CoA/propionyl-CoA carboxylase biotin carboxyl carrier protein